MDEWVLVPREPTEEMVETFSDDYTDPGPQSTGDLTRRVKKARVRNALRAMLAASPSPEGTRERGDRIGTHGVGCERWGYRHYECAVRRIEELEAAALTLPPVAGVDRDVVARIIDHLAFQAEPEMQPTADLRQAVVQRRHHALAKADAILALVSPLEGKGQGSSVAETAARGTTASRPDRPCQSEVRRLRAAAFEVVAATEQKADGSWVIGWDGEALIAALADAVGPMFCDGCGSAKGIAEIRSNGFVSCCPERSMRPPAESGAVDGGDGVPVHSLSAPDEPSLPDTSCKSEGV